MSLVAYGDSDDGSSDSEGEETTNFPSKISIISSAKPSNLTSERVQETIQTTPTELENVSLANSGKRSRLSSFLPKPSNPDNTTTVISRTNFSALDVQNLDNDEDEIIEVEEEYVPLSQIKKDKKTAASEINEEQKSVGSLFSRMPSPWSFSTGISLGKKKEENSGTDKNKKGKQPVKILAPTVTQADFDDDDNDDNKGPAAKRPKKSETGSGLSSLLPKPKHSVTTTAHNPNKPAAKLSNRPLIPHSLTKKPEAPKKDIKKAKKIESAGSGDEEDDSETVSFFSFEESKNNYESTLKKDFDTNESKTSTSVNIFGDIEPAGVQSSYTKSETITSIPEVASTAVNYGTSGVEGSLISYGEVEGRSHMDASCGNTPGMSQYYESSEATTTTYYQPSADMNQQYEYGTYSENPQTTHYGDNTQGMNNQTYGGHNQTQDIDIEKLKRLQGRGNRNEQINIIDISAADQTGDTQLQMTKITSEQIAHRPSKKKGNMPSSQQRRKHQITYLAFQAKEREFELQQQWSSNRQTKRQTQAKYGF